MGWSMGHVRGLLAPGLLVLIMLLISPAQHAVGQVAYKLRVRKGYIVSYEVAPGGRTGAFVSYTETYKIVDIKTATTKRYNVTLTYEYAVCEVTIKGFGKRQTKTVDLNERSRELVFFRIFYPVDEGYWSGVEKILENMAKEMPPEAEATYAVVVEDNVIHYYLEFKDPTTGRVNSLDEKVRLSDGVMIYFKIITEGVVAVVYTLGKAGPAVPWYVWPTVGAGAAAAVALVLWKKGILLRPKGIPPPP